jgi:hypothetical protein
MCYREYGGVRGSAESLLAEAVALTYGAFAVLEEIFPLAT